MIPGIAPGSSGIFIAKPVDANGNLDVLPSGVIPSWSIDQSTGFTLAPSTDGLNCQVNVDSSVVGGTSFTISCEATLPDGTVPKGSLNVPVFRMAVTGFVVEQTS